MASTLAEGARSLVTAHVVLREATVDDAPLIVHLRNDDPRETLPKVPGGIPGQVDYLRRYWAEPSRRRDEAYYVIVDRETSGAVGTVRHTALRDPCRMGWESLIVKPGTRPLVGIDVMFTTYRYCFESLGRPLLGPWRVFRRNTAMLRAHRHMRLARVIADDPASDVVWLAVTRAAYDEHSSRWASMGLGREAEPWPLVDGGGVS